MKYEIRVHATRCASSYVEVEADSMSEAFQIASKMADSGKIEFDGGDASTLGDYEFECDDDKGVTHVCKQEEVSDITASLPASEAGNPDREPSMDDVFNALHCRVKTFCNRYIGNGLMMEGNRNQLYFTLKANRKQDFNPDIRVEYKGGMTGREFLNALYDSIEEFRVGLVAALNSLGAAGDTPYPTCHYWDGYREIKERYAVNVRVCSRLKKSVRHFVKKYEKTLETLEQKGETE